MTVEAGTVARRIGGWLRVTVVLAIAATLPAQQGVNTAPAPFPLGMDPQGRVTDQQGEAIFGARIEVICVGSPKGYSLALREGIRRTPLMPAFSGRDGSYVLPLTELHRLVYGAGPGEFVLQVTMPGYEVWREPLSGGLYAYMGSDVVLTALDSLPRLAVKIPAPRPGMIFAVENSAMGPRPRYFAVPAEGALDLHLGVVSEPSDRVTGNYLRPWIRQGRLLYPGRSSVFGAIAYGEAVLHWHAEDAPGNKALEVRNPDGAEFSEVFGLYETADGRRLKFEFAGSELPRDSALTLRYVGAEGMLSREVGRDQVITMRRAPEHYGSLEVHVRDQEGAKVGHCTGVLWALEDGGAWTFGAAIPRPLGEIEGSAEGYLRIPRGMLAVPGLLELRAPGHLPQTFLEPRRWQGKVELELPRPLGGRLSFAVSSETGEPIAAAVLFLSDPAYAAGGLRYGLVRSDAYGRIALGGLQAGNYRYRCVATDRVPWVGRVLVEPGKDSTEAIELSAGGSLRLRTIDKSGQPLPFAQADLSQVLVNQQHGMGTVRSDSRGRLWLRGLPKDSRVGIDQRVLFAGDRQQVFPVGRDEEFACQLYASQPVLVRVPDGSRVAWGQHSTIASAILISWSGIRESELILGIEGGPPARVTGPEVRKPHVGKVHVVDRRKIVRRHRLELLGVEGADLRHLRIQPMRIDGRRSALSERGGQMVEVDEHGDPWFVARDFGAYRCRLLHPEYLLRVTSIPSQKNSTQAIVVRLVKGTQLSFRGTMTEKLLAGQEFSVYIQGDGLGGFIVHDFWRPPAGLRVGDPVSIPCPVAFAPGDYAVDLFLGTRRSYRSVLVLPQVPVALDLGKG